MDDHSPKILNRPASTDDQRNAPSDWPVDAYEQKQLQDLLSTLCEGMLGESEAKHLREILQRSKEARGTYIQYLYMHTNLAFSKTYAMKADQPVVLAEQLSSLTHRPSLTRQLDQWKYWGGSLIGRWPVVTKIAASLAAIFVGVVALSYLSASNEDTQASFSRNRVQYVARVMCDTGCRWDEETAASVHGGLLSSKDKLNLLEGLAKIRFDCGAEVILRGPAKLRIDSGMSCFLDSGDLSARVPVVAQGFTVHTPLGRVVDLGTEFGVSVDEEIEVHVFEGELELHPKNTSSASQEGLQQSGSGEEEVMVGLLAGAVRKMSLDEQSSKVRVLEIPEPVHQFIRSLPQLDGSSPRSRLNGMAVDSFGQGGPGTRLAGRNGGFGWEGPWISTPDSNSVSFLLGTNGAISRGSGDGVVERLLGPGLASAKLLYFSAEFRVNGSDPRCSAWLELFKFVPHHWCNGDINLAVIGITDGYFSGRLAPFGSQQEEQLIGNCGKYAEGGRHLIVGRLEFDAVGDQERLSVWVNPTLADEPTPDKVILRDTGQPGADAIAIRCWELDNETMATFDEVRVGRNWIDVVQ